MLSSRGIRNRLMSTDEFSSGGDGDGELSNVTPSGVMRLSTNLHN